MIPTPAPGGDQGRRLFRQSQHPRHPLPAHRVQHGQGGLAALDPGRSQSAAPEARHHLQEGSHRAAIHRHLLRLETQEWSSGQDLRIHTPQGVG